MRDFQELTTEEMAATDGGHVNNFFDLLFHLFGGSHAVVVQSNPFGGLFGGGFGSLFSPFSFGGFGGGLGQSLFYF